MPDMSQASLQEDDNDAVENSQESNQQSAPKAAQPVDLETIQQIARTLIREIQSSSNQHKAKKIAELKQKVLSWLIELSKEDRAKVCEAIRVIQTDEEWFPRKFVVKSMSNIAEFIQKNKKPDNDFTTLIEGVVGQADLKEILSSVNSKEKLSKETTTLLGLLSLGLLSYRGVGQPADYVSAAKYFKKAAKEGCSYAQAELGGMYHYGYGVSKNYQKSLEWFTKAAKQNDPRAQNNLGVIYENGYGVPQDDEEAEHWYRKAAKQGYLYAQSFLGFIRLRKSDASQQEKIEAFNWLKKAAKQGEPQVQNSLGLVYKNGYGVPQDDKKAVEWFKKATKQGYRAAQYNLGFMYANGRGGLSQNENKAFEWYEKAAKQGEISAIKQLAKRSINEIQKLSNPHKARKLVEFRQKVLLWLMELSKEDRAEACEAIRKAQTDEEWFPSEEVFNVENISSTAEFIQKNKTPDNDFTTLKEGVVGQTDLQKVLSSVNSKEDLSKETTTLLGLLSYVGVGQPVDYVSAAKYFEKAAEEGCTQAQTKLSVMYCYGRGVLLDYDKSIKWNTKAVQQDDPQAQFTFGFMRRHGYGMSQQYSNAFKWYRKAAKQDCTSAQCSLATMYKEGWGVRKDHDAAAMWFEKAAKLGNPDAQYNLATMFYNGVGVNRDAGEAFANYSKAARQGMVKAQVALGNWYKKGPFLPNPNRLTKAYKWYRKAALQGNVEAMGYLAEKIIQEITDEQDEGNQVKKIVAFKENVLLWLLKASEENRERANKRIKALMTNKNWSPNKKIFNLDAITKNAAYINDSMEKYGFDLKQARVWVKHKKQLLVFVLNEGPKDKEKPVLFGEPKYNDAWANIWIHLTGLSDISVSDMFKKLELNREYIKNDYKNFVRLRAELQKSITEHEENISYSLKHRQLISSLQTKIKRSRNLDHLAKIVRCYHQTLKQAGGDLFKILKPYDAELIELTYPQEKEKTDVLSSNNEKEVIDLRKKINMAIFGKTILTNTETSKLREEKPDTNADSYLKWMQEHATGTRGISRITNLSHGSSGIERAFKLARVVNRQGVTAAEIKAELLKVLQHSGNTKHSLSRYLLAQLMTFSAPITQTAAIEIRESSETPEAQGTRPVNLPSRDDSALVQSTQSMQFFPPSTETKTPTKPSKLADVQKLPKNNFRAKRGEYVKSTLLPSLTPTAAGAA